MGNNIFFVPNPPYVLNKEENGNQEFRDFNNSKYKYLEEWDPKNDPNKDDKKVGGFQAHYTFEALRLQKLMEKASEEDREVLEKEAKIAFSLSKSYF